MPQDQRNVHLPSTTDPASDAATTWVPKITLSRAGTTAHVPRPVQFQELSIDLASVDPPSLSRNMSKCSSPPKPQRLQTSKASPNSNKTFPSGFSISAAMVLTPGSPLTSENSLTLPFHELFNNDTVDAPNNNSNANNASPVQQMSSRRAVVSPKTMECEMIPPWKPNTLPPDSRTKQLVFGGGYLVEPQVLSTGRTSQTSPKRSTSTSVVMKDATGHPLF
ncbi:hypothetical protein AC1031_018006 [Aphanomyces cochlioides]|nr:hypothetical protein AC1031_018006 [Aphanomyces cochlioides]